MSMKKSFLLPALAFSIFHFPLSIRAAVLDAVTFDIQEGWNAIYLPLTPTNAADDVFADWPVGSVGFYDQAAFLRTKQFDTSAEETTLGAVENGMKMWYRDEPGKSGFDTLVANGNYVSNATTAVRRVVTGVPSAMRVSWHVATVTNAPLNFVGISTDGSVATLTQNAYFQGLDTGWTIEKNIIRHPWGFDTAPTLDFFSGGTPKMGNLGVVAMDAAKASDWSGALNVSPVNGLDFGTNVCQGAIRIRNDSGTNRTVRVDLRRMDSNVFTALPLLSDILFLDPARHTAWQHNFVTTGYARELVAGETLTLRLAIDRTALADVAAGTEYGGLLSVTDVSSERPTYFRTTVPFAFASDGGAFLKSQWPKGLWLATLSLDKVSRTIPKDKVESCEDQVTLYEVDVPTVTTNAQTHVVSTNYVKELIAKTNSLPVYATSPIAAGSTMTMRVLVHVDANGAMKLLQRARVNGRRLSSVVLPTDAPEVAGTGTFGTQAAFAWTVADTSRVNPFRHARHPDHDGLDASFEKTLPSGDDFANYNGTVKPELFSVSNALTLDWAAATAAAAWNPEETLSGTCTWKLTGLRREGAITTTGSFTMRRVAAADLKDIEENFK